MEIADIRKEYNRGGLSRCQAPDDPLVLFQRWLSEALGAGLEAGLVEPTAMVVATVAADGRPSTRTVLLKELRDGQFIFYTNYASRKGVQLAANPHIALTFPWYGLERQVHIEGVAARLSGEESDAYFASRPEASRIGAVVSPQSRVIDSRTALRQAFEQKRQELAAGGGAIARPSHWGGYGVTPERIEFWQGGPHRLHDRILYTRQSDGRWLKERLAP